MTGADVENGNVPPGGHATDSAIGAAIEVAVAGLDRGELPIGAVVFDAEQVLGSAYTQERAQGRRLVHADLLALEQADKALGFRPASGDPTLAVTVEPCLVCVGAAVALGVSRVWFALESPDDGAAELLRVRQPPVRSPHFVKPREVLGGIRRDESRRLFRRYAEGTGPAGMRRWAQQHGNQ
ncbi:nucleoside deaminase [Rhodococcoides fascians]|uniref:nucleoside deaminase n=1 Tax=Rhodococcoides fascians TaxID=1828 RepID=UPI000B17D66B|nr:nucleoside deaminase [Rhodococcus fascians]